MAKNGSSVGGPVVPKAGGDASTMKPFANAVAGTSFVGDGEIGLLGLGRLGFGQDTVMKDAIANREIINWAVSGFSSHKILPGKANGFRGAKPTEPEGEVGKFSKGGFTMFGGGSGKG